MGEIWLSVGMTRKEWDDVIEALGQTTTGMAPGKQRDALQLLEGSLSDAWLCADTEGCEDCDCEDGDDDQ